MEPQSPTEVFNVDQLFNDDNEPYNSESNNLLTESHRSFTSDSKGELLVFPTSLPDEDVALPEILPQHLDSLPDYEQLQQQQQQQPISLSPQQQQQQQQLSTYSIKFSSNLIYPLQQQQQLSTLYPQQNEYSTNSPGYSCQGSPDTNVVTSSSPSSSSSSSPVSETCQDQEQNQSNKNNDKTNRIKKKRTQRKRKFSEVETNQDLTEEERKLRARKERNRLSAKKSRDRQKQRLAELEEENKALRRENAELRAKLEKYESATNNNITNSNNNNNNCNHNNREWFPSNTRMPYKSTACACFLVFCLLWITNIMPPSPDHFNENIEMTAPKRSLLAQPVDNNQAEMELAMTKVGTFNSDAIIELPSMLKPYLESNDQEIENLNIIHTDQDSARSVISLPSTQNENNVGQVFYCPALLPLPAPGQASVPIYSVYLYTNSSQTLDFETEQNSFILAKLKKMPGEHMDTNSIRAVKQKNMII